MKTKKLAAMLITVSMVLGSMSGLVWADTETESTEPSTEQVTEITDETSDETESSEATEEVEEIEVDEEEAEETEASEEIDETIETEADEDIAVEEEGDVYDAEDSVEWTEVYSWSDIETALNTNGKTHLILQNDISVEGSAGSIMVRSGSDVVINLNECTISMENSTASNAYFFQKVSPFNLTIMHGTLTRGHCLSGAGAIEVNSGCLILDDITIDHCGGNFGAVYVNNGSVNLINTTITDNTSVYEGAGVRCNANGYINKIDGKVTISNNRSNASVAQYEYYVDDLYYSEFSHSITIGESFSSRSDIYISGIHPNSVVTSGWNGKSYFNVVFHFEEDLQPVLNMNGEVCIPAISYIARSWNGTSLDVEPASIGVYQSY